MCSAIQLRHMEELNANGAAVDAPGLVGVFAGEAVEVGAFERCKVAEGIERGLVETPTAEEVKDAFAFGVAGAVTSRNLFRSFRRLFRSERHTVCHSS